MAEVQGMTVAKATPEDITAMREFLFQLEEKVNDPENSLSEIGKFVHARFNSECGCHFQRILFGYETLIDNACDPSLSYLDWKPEIKKALYGG
jgi:hypothetical protein